MHKQTELWSALLQGLTPQHILREAEVRTIVPFPEGECCISYVVAFHKDLHSCKGCKSNYVIGSLLFCLCEPVVDCGGGWLLHRERGREFSPNAFLLTGWKFTVCITEAIWDESNSMF